MKLVVGKTTKTAQPCEKTLCLCVFGTGYPDSFCLSRASAVGAHAEGPRRTQAGDEALIGNHCPAVVIPIGMLAAEDAVVLDQFVVGGVVVIGGVGSQNRVSFVLVMQHMVNTDTILGPLT